MTVMATCFFTLSLIAINIKLSDLFPHEPSSKNIEHTKLETSYALDAFKESFASETTKRNKSFAEAIEKDDVILNQRAHISDFTNPRTGLNPFLDLVEGTYTGSSRQGATIPEKPTRVPKFESRTHPSYSLPSYHQWPPDIVEGASNPRQKLSLDPGKSLEEDSSNGRIRVFPTNVFPFRENSPTTTNPPRVQKPIKFTPTRKCEPSKPLPITDEVNLNKEATTTSIPNNKKEIITAREKNLSNNSNRNFTIGITILGIAVVFFTIMLATCLWKQRTKRVPRHATLRNVVNNEPVRGRSMQT